MGNKKTPDCRRCKHMKEYRSVADETLIIRICSCDEWRDDEDGAFGLIEVSHFNSADCIMFREVDG
jgi:hypothetical protein